MKELSAYELEAASGELLPARETLAIGNYNNIIKFAAYNVASNYANGYNITQNATANQSISFVAYQYQ